MHQHGNTDSVQGNPESSGVIDWVGTQHAGR